MDDKELEYVSDAVKNGWNNEWNKYLLKFEKKACDYLSMPYAMCTSSCTGALHLALASLGIGEGDEVIVPDMTWIATVSAIKYVNATPVFVDIEKRTWTIDADKIEAAITNKTKAIIPVHIYGHPCEMDKILDIAKKHELYVIEDAAPSMGAEYKGRKTGSFGTFAAFSFQGAKLLVTGEGGMLLCNDKSLFEIAKNLNDHGRDPVIPFWINRIGFKYKMSNIQAAFGLGQLEKIDYLVKCKRNIFNWYNKRIGNHKFFTLNHERSDIGAKSIYWMTSILLKEDCPVTRDEVMKKLDIDYNIDSRPVFPQISKFPMFNNVDNPIAEYVSKNAINLPSGVCLSEKDVNKVCDAIIEIFKDE